MYLYKQKMKNGDTYLAIKEKYYSREKGTRERTVESLGYLSELSKQYTDPIEHFKEYAKELTEKKKQDNIKTISIDMNEKLTVGTNNFRNVGYGILKQLYRDLDINVFWNWKERNLKTQFSTDQIFRLLVFSRVLNPGSKRYTLNSKNFFFEPFDGMSLDDIYHALDIIADNRKALQEWVFKSSQKLVNRDMSVSYFDCTNYYFDISKPDIDILDDDGFPIDENGNPTNPKYRKRGPEKNHRPDPIVEMGLLLDRNGIPVAFDLFPGNESEKVHMRPVIDWVKQEMTDSRVIFVADRGLNTSDNIYWLNGDNKRNNNQRDGYVYGQSVRGASDEFKEWVLSGGYQKTKVADGDDEIYFIHKSRIAVKELNVNLTKKNEKAKTKVQVDQKQMVYYSAKYAKKQKADRDAMIARADDLIKHPKKYDRISAKGSAAYIRNIAFDSNTGEVVEGKNLSLDIEKIKEEEKYDGYYSIVTSELDMDDITMRKVYKGLARIEDSFKVTKTYFSARPVHVRTNKHIEAHFTVCFMALVLMRLLENKLGYKYSAGNIINSLKNYNCTQIDKNDWQFMYYDEILKDIGQTFNLQLDSKHRTMREIQRLLRY